MIRRKILIAYADETMSFSLRRIGILAKLSGCFDKVHLYTPSSLPVYVRESPLMKYQRGGGYWAWKPAIIWEELQRNQEGDIVVYVDAGCTLRKTDEWKVYFNEMETHDTLCFQYKDFISMFDNKNGWHEKSSKIKYWTKTRTLAFFEDLLGDPFYGSKYNKVWGGFIICKNKENKFLKHWLEITMQNPDLIIDPSTDEDERTNSDLISHRHDQSIITPLCHYYTNEVLVLTERGETDSYSAVVGSRIRVKTFLDYAWLIARTRLKFIK